MAKQKKLKRLDTKHVRAMTKALEAVPHFKVEKTATTVLVKTQKNVELFRALKMRSVDLWTVSHVEDLFTEEGK